MRQVGARVFVFGESGAAGARAGVLRDLGRYRLYSLFVIGKPLSGHK